MNIYGLIDLYFDNCLRLQKLNIIYHYIIILLIKLQTKTVKYFVTRGSKLVLRVIINNYYVYIYTTIYSMSRKFES